MTKVTTLNRNMKFGQLKDVETTSATDALMIKVDGKFKETEPLAYLEEQLDPVYMDLETGATKSFAIAMAVVL